jgi:hypothetical protein
MTDAGEHQPALLQGEHMSAAGPPGRASATGADATSGEGIKRRRWALLLIAVSLLFVLLGTVGALYQGNLIWLNRLEHPFLFGSVAAAAFGVGACRLIATDWLRVLVGMVTIVVGGGWFFLGVMVFSMSGTYLFPAATADAPDDHEYKAVVHKGESWIGDTWYSVSIRQTRGLLSREWPAGCISGDGNFGPLSIHQVRWPSPSRVRVTLGSQAYGTTISVDPRTGKPKSPARGSC